LDEISRGLIMHEIRIGEGAALQLRYMNRHTLVTGATGTGKTVTLQRIIEGLSAAGVPVLAADIKGDLSGVATHFPTRFWDLWQEKGIPLRASVEEMGPLLVSSMLQLNDTQAGVCAIAFKYQGPFCRTPLQTLHCLRSRMAMMLDYAAELKTEYGHFTAASIGTIQRQSLVLASQGGDHLFGEPALDIRDLMQTAPDGRGWVSLLHADRLMEAPKLYASLLLWLLNELFRVLPEVGDLDRPKMALVADEAHLLFSEAPPKLLETIERTVRLIRSRGVAVIFVTQSPRDVPDTVLAQVSNRIQHGLRAYTPKERRALRAVADSFRAPEGMTERQARQWITDAVQNLGVGDALVSTLGEGGIPTPVKRVKVDQPAAMIGPVDDTERALMLRADAMFQKYGVSLTEDEQWNALRARLGLPLYNSSPAVKRSWWQRLSGEAA
jgi:DNA helicase HerA-like ATPase